jgi:hypothetical protein
MIKYDMFDMSIKELTSIVFNNISESKYEPSYEPSRFASTFTGTFPKKRQIICLLVFVWYLYDYYSYVYHFSRQEPSGIEHVVSFIHSSPWWWWQYAPLKRWSSPMRLHEAICHKVLIFILPLWDQKYHITFLVSCIFNTIPHVINNSAYSWSEWPF